MSDPALNLVVIRSRDPERSGRFYAALGLQMRQERHGSGPEHLAIQAGPEVEVYPPDGQEATTAVRLGFRVPDLSTAVSAAVLAGGTVISEPRTSPWGLRAVLANPDGHRVELVEGS